jgi:hypothetical protein
MAEGIRLSKYILDPLYLGRDINIFQNYTRELNGLLGGEIKERLN